MEINYPGLYDNRSTPVSCQMPMDKWHALISDPTLGDALLDQPAHTAFDA